MKHTLFAGCSFTAGSGFELEKQQPELWVNLLHNKVEQLNKTKLINVAQGGRSNGSIFADTVHGMLNYDCEYVFVAWTSMPRYETELGLETYRTRQVFMPNATILEHKLHHQTYSKNYLTNVNDRFVSLAHLHYEISQLVYYVNTLVKLAELKNSKIFFINSYCPWDENFFEYSDNAQPNTYTKFTNQLIDIETRDTTEIIKLYKKLHNEYKSHGGIKQTHWLNLYNSLRDYKTDVNSDNAHPGIESNKFYCYFLSKILSTKI